MLGIKDIETVRISAMRISNFLLIDLKIKSPHIIRASILFGLTPL